jgi:RimJ/RimL family protein N-acetyltransferase
VGWRLRRDAWGHGYATEGARAALRAGFEEFGLEEVTAFIHPDNHRSSAVADRLGMMYETRVPHPDRPHDVDVYVARAS